MFSNPLEKVLLFLARDVGREPHPPARDGPGSEGVCRIISGNAKIALGSDHAGFDLKEAVKDHLSGRGLVPVDFGTDSIQSVDYPDYARKVCEALLAGEVERGILICGTGLGMSMMANRYRGVRGALCHDHFTARAARSHNNSNVLTLGGRILGADLAKEIVDTWLDTPFDGGRHERRTRKFDE